jgi:hypothetical protein
MWIDFFGNSVSISGDTAVVGAYEDDDDGWSSGSAYVFVRDVTTGTWTEQAKLTASDAAGGDKFGYSVSVSGDTVLIGAYWDDDAGFQSGSAYVFVRSGSTWTEQAKLTASDGAAGDYFGDSVSVSGDTALIGAYRDDYAGTYSGSAYVFVRSGSTWTQQAKLTASDGAAWAYFGHSVSVSGDTALIGAAWDSDAGGNSGSAYMYDLAQTYTPEGENVEVNPHPDVSMTFDDITESGITDVATSDSNPGAGLANFKFLGTYYDIATTAIFNDDITICISYDDTGIPAGKEANLKIFHWDGTDWVDSTISLDTTNNIICAEISSLSWFALAYLDNAPPEVTLTGPASGSIFPVGNPVPFRGTFTDPNTEDSHTAIWEFSSLNNDISLAGTVTESSGSGTVSNDYSFTTPGVYSVSLTVSDGGLQDTATTIGDLDVMVIIYDPEDGFVTGGGWINSPEGAYSADSSLTGKASYGFVSKYQKGADTPTGETQFQFKVADLDFHSTAYDWLVVGGARAQYKGTGTINDEGDYGFMLTAVDGDLNGGGGEDKFRIKIWDKATNVIVYDNQMDAEDDADLSTMIGGGCIKIHKG